MTENSRISVRGTQEPPRAAEKNDWDTHPMPLRRAFFLLKRKFTPQQMDRLRSGNIPQEMEDKWFRYMEGSTLFAHRSWTGFCIYRVRFFACGLQLVTVNRSPKQYDCRSRAADREQLSRLLDRWSAPSRNARREWLEETVSALHGSGTPGPADSVSRRP